MLCQLCAMTTLDAEEAHLQVVSGGGRVGSAAIHFKLSRRSLPASRLINRHALEKPSAQH